MNVLAVLAAVALFLAAFGVHVGSVNLVWLGFGLWALSCGLPVLPLRRP